MGEPEYTDIERHAGDRAGVVISVRLKPDEAGLLRGLSERDGRTMSETLRVALHAFAHQPSPDALGQLGQYPMTRGGVFLGDPADLVLT